MALDPVRAYEAPKARAAETWSDRWARSTAADDLVGLSTASSISGRSMLDLYRAVREGALVEVDGRLRRADVEAWAPRPTADDSRRRDTRSIRRTMTA